MRRKCRIWWPKHLALTATTLNSDNSVVDVLFGWCFCSSSSLDSIDIVVAFALDEITLSRSKSNLQAILDDADGNMPVFLQDRATFSVLGHCVTDASSNDQLFTVGTERGDKGRSFRCRSASSPNNIDGGRRYNAQRSCGCHTLNGALDQCGQGSMKNSNWIQLVYGSHKQFGKEIYKIPILHHMHWNGGVVSQCDVHVIVYDSPTYGSHHFSLCTLDSSKQETSVKKPQWVDELHRNQSLIDLDVVVLAINCATAAKLICKRHVCLKKSSARFLILTMLLGSIWQLLAIFVASLSTLLYIMLQFLRAISSYGLQSCVYTGLVKMLAATWTNIQIRCSQVLYWPVLLQDINIREKSCVEYEEKATLHRHAMWSSLAVDVLLGNLIGFALFYHAESVSHWMSAFASNITNMLLRSGCVWLMGNPAGFKLNTELAEVLGIMCLNAIQIWSALWILLSSSFVYFIRGLALSGILFGVTIPAALVMDMIAFATLHVSTLHWLISLLYSLQIQALASLWRLFRGRKWNPLRQRLDSYDYNVEQHIVGSLLFTPLFLLLPTTSVFYIFFSMLHTSICLTRMLIEVAISIVHATPYFKILLWLVNRRRFPSGLWFELLSCSTDVIDSQWTMSGDETNSQSLNSKRLGTSTGKRYSVISILRSNVISIGQVIFPHYRNVFYCIPGSFGATSAYGILSGKGIPSTLGTGLPTAKPWMSIPYKEYWCLCRNSVLACSGR